MYNINDFKGGQRHEDIVINEANDELLITDSEKKIYPFTLNNILLQINNTNTDDDNYTILIDYIMSLQTDNKYIFEREINNNTILITYPVFWLKCVYRFNISNSVVIFTIQLKIYLPSMCYLYKIEYEDKTQNTNQHGSEFDRELTDDEHAIYTESTSIMTFINKIAENFREEYKLKKHDKNIHPASTEYEYYKRC